MAFSLKTESATPKAHSRHFSCRSKNAYRVSRVENPGLRFCSAPLGKWISRDPIGERGGRNLYMMIRNRPLDRRDPFGLTNQPGDFGWDMYTPPTPSASESGFFGTAANWLGSGGDVHLSFSSYDPEWKPSDFKGFHSKVSKVCSSKKAEKNFTLKQPRDLYSEGLGTIAAIGGPGRYNVALTGDLTSDGCTWSFDGRVYAPPDKCDFDPDWDWSWWDGDREQRTEMGELITRDVWAFHEITGLGKDFWFYFDGERKVTENGKCGQ